MPIFNQNFPFGFKNLKTEARFSAKAMKNTASFQLAVLFLPSIPEICGFFPTKSSFLIVLFCVISCYFLQKFKENSSFRLNLAVFSLLVAINLLFSLFIAIKKPEYLVFWLFLFTISGQKTVKSLLIYSFSSFLLIYFCLSWEKVQETYRLLPLFVFLMYFYERDCRNSFISQEKEVKSLGCKAQILDYLPRVLFIINRNGSIIFKNSLANSLFGEETANINSILNEKSKKKFEEIISNLNIHDETKWYPFENKFDEKCEILLKVLIWDEGLRIMLLIKTNKSKQYILKNTISVNKLLSKMTARLLENMETDYSKWSNLQALKHIKQSDMKLLANCILDANFLKCFIQAHVEKTKILLEIDNKSKKKQRLFNIRNTIIHILEIISVMSLVKHQEISLKFEESFPDKVSGDYSRFKESFLVIWRQISLKYDKAEFQMYCRLKEVSKSNQFILVFLIFLPENPQFFSLLNQIIGDNASLSDNIIRETYESFDLLMFKPLISTLSGNLSFEPEKKALVIELPLEPASEFEPKSPIKHNKTPLILTFCRTNPDKHTYKWKERQFVGEESEKSRAIQQKFKKIVCLKEMNKVLSQENENNLQIVHKSSNDNTSDQPSSREESPEMNEIKTRKKTYSCFSKDHVPNITTNSTNGGPLLMTPQGSHQNNSEFLRTPSKKHSSEINSFHGLHYENSNKYENIQENYQGLTRENSKNNHENNENSNFNNNYYINKPRIREESVEFPSPYHNILEKNYHKLIQEDLNDLENVNFFGKFKEINKFSSCSSTNLLGNERKKEVFERKVYESVLQSWKTHENSLKRRLMLTIYTALDKMDKEFNVCFRKDTLKTKEKRLNSLPIINSLTSLHSGNNNEDIKTPYGTSRKNLPTKKNKQKFEDLLELRPLDYWSLQQEKMLFLNSRLLLSPRTMPNKNANVKIKGGFKLTVLQTEVLKPRLVTCKRKWLIRNR